MAEQSNPSQINSGPPKLRAMGFGALLDMVFSLYRAHFWLFFGIASGYFMAMALVISITFLDDSIGRSVGIAIWVPIVISIFGISVFVVNALVVAGTQAYLGETIRIGAVLRQAIRHFFRCFIGSLLFALLVILSTFLFVFVLTLLLLFPGPVTEIATINLILGSSFMLILAFFTALFLTYWCFYISAILVERKSIRTGLKRSRELIKGTRLRVTGTVFAILLLSVVIGVILRVTFAFPLTLLGLKGMGDFFQNVQWMVLWELPTKQSELLVSYAIMYLINLGIDTFVMPIWVIGCTLLYFDQRIRKEGFDIEVMATRQGE